MGKQNADIVIGPPCPQGLMMAHLSNIYRTAWMGWGYVTNPEFALADKYPFVTALIAPSSTIGDCALEVIAEFKWDIISILYTSNEVRFCDDIVDSVMSSIGDSSASFVPTVAVKQVLDVNNNESYTRILQQVQSRSRGTFTLS
ncbi:hypothetical protein NECAME_12769 [Necator americanus]|uniref:Receptor ligand binding region domain-containing protein n=1 Tax=Necator americanus TaxID=51031 RepID=W2T168_NECAM|nr:hypothetical protein NECAME_12769 [Necator americanus]ETN74722.1 hypothetical protein NECAME_12769 [Necator americanus]